ncbi:hypothetical protein D3C87_513640 [compost metagenome]
MQLLYVYIGGYIEVSDGPYKGDVSDQPFRVLKDIELNFSNKFIFEFDEFNLLDVKKNNAYVPYFFDDNGLIKSVSAIIGKNGAGKTSIIELLKWLQPDNLHKVPYKLLLVYGNIEFETDQVFTILKNNELNCELSNIFSKSIEIKEFYRRNNGVVKGLDPFEVPQELEILKQIYYSPIFEVQFSNLSAEHEVYGDQNIVDISTSHLLEKDAEDSINGNSKTLTSKEVLVRHKLSDVERQYEILKSSVEFEKLLGFKKPEYIELIIDTSDYTFIKDWEKIKEYNSIFPEDVTTFYPSAQNFFCFHLLKHIIFNFIRETFLNSGYLNHEIDKLINAIPEKEQNQSLEDWIKLYSQNITASRFFDTERLLERIDFVLMFYKLDSPDKRFRYANNTRCRLHVSNDKEILDKYFEIKNLSGFLHLDWKYNLYDNGQLSSGEKAKFNLFSRFFSVLKKVEWKEGNLDNLLILVDEGDTLFHPEWQRKFLKDFINGLKLIFTKTKSIQLILTTHSPFVTSDLPWYSIIKLNKDIETGLTKVDYNDSTLSFAANIHDLFADSFYMENGFIGQFAVEKIETLFKKIEDSNKDQITLLEKEINLIGEPFIKMSLLESLNEKFFNE